MKPREPENPEKINYAYDVAYPRTWHAAPSGHAAGDGSLDPLDMPTHAEMLLALRAADEMARICDDMVQRGTIDARSALADARLNYGQPYEYKWSGHIMAGHSPREQL